MGLHRFKPMPSGRMGIFWTLAPIKEAAVVEFGCMGHNLYSGSALKRGGIYEGYGASLYTTYIDETDISLGDTSRLDATISHVIESEHPRVIFLQPSAVPEVIGTDMTAISNIMQPKFPGVRLIPMGHGSFDITPHRGVSEALLTLVNTIPADIANAAAPASTHSHAAPQPTYNIIGSCPDIFRYHADAGEVIRLMRGAFGMDACCVLSSGASVSDIENMGAASVNLVIRQEGVAAAKALQERFGTPYVYGRPYGIKGTSRWLGEVGEALASAPDGAFISSEEALAYDQIDRAYDYMEGNE